MYGYKKKEQKINKNKNSDVKKDIEQNVDNNDDKYFRILSIDGGGVRGIIPITFLERLQNKFPKLISSVDMFAGTSVGSLIILSLALGKTPKEISEFIESDYTNFFKDPSRAIIQPKYTNTNRIPTIIKFLPEVEKSISSITKKIVVPAFEPASFTSVFFNNYANSSTLDATVLDTMISSMSFPILWNSYKGNVDGGVVANNPSLAALSLALNKSMGNIDISKVIVLSIGTGFNNWSINEKDWGALQWGYNFSNAAEPEFPLSTLISEAPVGATDLYNSSILEKNYFRLDLNLDQERIRSDDINAIPKLKLKAEVQDLLDVEEFIASRWVKL
ncbi:patatin-like phospholipase family protein [Longirhabdus pacifica]|uniref:patatin-like phospholipase family protein n=1 Tax=Longirhabdus pacifica TaxID=2305227 RepID=UPI0010090934|nr:patatin-like phospholipase family protein [Longirhabdus pacifica]